MISPTFFQSCGKPNEDTLKSIENAKRFLKEYKGGIAVVYRNPRSNVVDFYHGDVLDVAVQKGLLVEPETGIRKSYEYVEDAQKNLVNVFKQIGEILYWDLFDSGRLENMYNDLVKRHAEIISDKNPS